MPVAPSNVSPSSSTPLSHTGGPDAGRVIRGVAAQAVLFLGLLAAAFVAMRLVSLPPTHLTAIWLPAGIALLALRGRLGWSALPTIFLAHWAIIALANNYAFLSFRPWSLAMAAVNTAGPALGLLAWRRWIKVPPFEDGWAYLRFVFLVALGPAVLTAWMIPGVILAAGYLPDITLADFLVRAGVITMSDTLGVFLFVPIMLAPWRGGLLRGTTALTLAHIASFALTLAVAALSFHVTPLAVYLVVPLALVSAIICGARAVGISVLTFAIYGLLATASGLGPFVVEDAPAFTPLLGMTVFALCVGIPGQFAGITLEQLRRHREQLSNQVTQRTSALQASEERYRLALDAVTEGVFDWEHGKGQPPQHNRAVPRILGYDPEEFVAHWRPLMRLVHPEDRRAISAIIAEAMRGHSDQFEVEMRLRTKHGGWRWLRLRGKVVAKTAASRAGRIVGTVSDINTSKQQSLALAAAKEVAESADRAKSAFLAAMSHEIRTPMHGVLGFARVLESSTLNARQRECIDSILVSGSMLLTLLNDILDLSKIEAGAIELDPTPNSLRRAVADTVQLFTAEAANKGIALASTVADDLPDHFSFDTLRLHQVIANLIGNAIKFTDVGSVTVTVGGAPLDIGIEPSAEAWELQCEIADTGIGIDPAHRDRLFTSFGQADSSITRRFGGSGLGLAISKRLCELMGGTIRLQSEAGRGSTFTASFRLQRLAEVAPASPAEPDSEGTTGDRETSGSLRVLVAEDNRLNQRLVGMLLERLGHHAEFVVNGEIAVERVGHATYDLVLMDVQMPVMDGRTATRRIRELESRNPERPRLPIIAVTADAMLEDRERCLEVGMDAVLTKPLDPRLFRETLARFAHRT